MAEVSVIIPVYNGEGYLQQCLDSIPRDLDVEVWLIDDGSTDGSLQIGAAAGVRCLEAAGPSQGPAAARNRGLQVAQSPYLAFLDSDDWWPEGSLQERLRVLKEHPGLGVVQGLIETREHGPLPKAVAERRLEAPTYNVNLGACLFRRDVLERVGPFDETLRFGEDTDCFMRLWEDNIPKLFLSLTCLYYRLHQTNMTGEGPEDMRTKLKLLKRHKDRMKGRVAEEKVGIERYIGWVPPESMSGDYTRDYVSLRLPRWKEWFGSLPGTTNLSILELGSYEGRSANWFLANLCTQPDSHLTCVDFFSEPAVEARFDRNLSRALEMGRVTKVKESTHRWLVRQPKATYDLIYIDASHRAGDVLLDALLSWRLLRPGGRILFDDYLWRYGTDPMERPQLAIDLLLEAKLEGLELLHRGYQVLIGKRSGG